MKKRMKRITSILLVLLLAVTAVLLAACGSDSDAAPKNSTSDSGNQSPADDNGDEPAETEAGTEVIETVEEEGVKYELYGDGTLKVSGEGSAYCYEDSWEDQITKVIAEEGITSMTFYDCNSLTEVVIPGSVQVIENDAFRGCDSLTKVSVQEGVIRIDGNAFYQCASLAEIELPDSLIFVGEYPFKETALFNNPVDGVVYADNVAIGYTNIQGSPKFKEGTRIIADHAFDGLGSITSVTFPNSVIRIGEFAFYNCTNLSEINVPDSVYSIGNCAFDQTPWFNNQPEDAVVYAGKVAYKLRHAGVHDLVLKEGTVGIADHAFEDCYFDTVTLPSGLKWIGGGSDLTPNKQEELVIPDGVTHIGWISLSAPNVIIPASVTYIEEGTFSNATIIAPKGSYAESYALKNNILFKER